ILVFGVRHEGVAKRFEVPRVVAQLAPPHEVRQHPFDPFEEREAARIGDLGALGVVAVEDLRQPVRVPDQRLVEVPEEGPLLTGDHAEWGHRGLEGQVVHGGRDVAQLALDTVELGGDLVQVVPDLAELRDHHVTGTLVPGQLSDPLDPGEEAFLGERRPGPGPDPPERAGVPHARGARRGPRRPPLAAADLALRLRLGGRGRQRGDEAERRERGDEQQLARSACGNRSAGTSGAGTSDGHLISPDRLWIAPCIGPPEGLLKDSYPARRRPLVAPRRGGQPTCWTAQPLPSGSVKKTKRPQGKSWTSPTSTPRASRSSRARSMSGTTSCRPSREPGGIWWAPLVRAIEQAEPGGVSWTKRSSSVTWWSCSA